MIAFSCTFLCWQCQYNIVRAAFPVRLINEPPSAGFHVSRIVPGRHAKRVSVPTSLLRLHRRRHRNRALRVAYAEDDLANGLAVDEHVQRVGVLLQRKDLRDAGREFPVPKQLE